ncbi:MAG: DNA-binding response regulator [Gammaproteobacteria bacterium HGW-Gammaproteobacteria-1]|jgi:DNA-binding NarL/FixJ family response regulator|nr:MAG: DNA-binding response regulator [Gammaproteobacteria bacterium HGW-Gammaproteobacteria-1]
MNIILIDDHRIIREGIRSLLEQQPDMFVIGEADDGREGIALVRQLRPDIVVMDITMPRLNGIDATRHILAENRAPKVIALSMHAHRHLVQGILREGASGYLLKECAFDELVHALRVVVERGQIYLSPGIANVVVHGFLHKADREDATGGVPALTSREREILQLVVEGNSNDQVGRLLNMSGRTVEKHRAQIMGKLKVDGLVGLVRYAIREGLTTP